MRISVTTENETFSLEVSEDLELENFKVLCEAECGIPSSDILVAYNGRRLSDEKKSLKDYGIRDEDLLMVVSGTSVIQRAAERMQRRETQPMDVNQFDFGSIRVPGQGERSSSGEPSSEAAGADIPVSSSGAGAGSSSATAQGQESDSSSRAQGNNHDDLGLGENAGSQDDPAVIRDMLLANPEQLALLKHNNPKLADALTSGDLELFGNVLREQQEARSARERQRIRLISADPFDMEAQELIAREIQQENINANMEAAMEFNPESFGTVHMLYINCYVNGHPVKAFIDSGAQTTIMSQACAERCNIMRLVDNRWAGIAKGVGTQKIIGRVHMGQIQIEGDFLASSFSILEEQPMDMLLGLDMLKRHQMCIDLKENRLVIGTTSSSTRFLNESELPDCARLTALTEEEVLKQSESSARQSEDQALAKALSESARENTNPVINGASAVQHPPTDKALPTDSKTPPSDGTSPPSEHKTPPTESPSGVAPSSASDMRFSESDIKEIMQIGFSRDEVLAELRKQNGNKTQAIAALFAKSFKMEH